MRMFVPILIMSLLLFSSCSKKKKEQDKKSFFILVNLFDNSRSGKDYVRLSVNDSLLFSGLYLTDYSEKNINDIWGMKVAACEKQDKDSVKIRLVLISLDDTLFLEKSRVDTTFYYRIRDIPGISIAFPREIGHFSIFDTINAPTYWIVE